MDDKNVVKVITTLNSGAAKPIAVTRAEAQNLAQQQSVQLEEKHQEQVRQLMIKEGEVTTEQPVVNNPQPKINKDVLSIETQAAVEDLYSEKVMYKIVEQKTNWKLVIIMLLVLAIIGIVIIAELSIFQ